MTRIVGVSAKGTTSYSFYNFNQKLFEFGDGGTAGIVIWGLASIGNYSYRTLFAETHEQATASNLGTLSDVAKVLSVNFWNHYSHTFASELSVVKNGKDTPEGKDAIKRLQGGFCLAGRWGTSKTCEAFVITYDPSLQAPPVPVALQMNNPGVWGWRNILERIFVGFDPQVLVDVIASGKWQGTPQELLSILRRRTLKPPVGLPIREAVDWVHSSLFTTIKTLKFTELPRVCGGFIDIAVITTDRPFRWVRHKGMGDAIRQSHTEGGAYGELDL